MRSKLRDRGGAAFLTRLAAEWKARYPDQIFRIQFVDDQIAQLYVSESIQQQLIWMAASLAILISCLGMLGLVSLNVQHRTKEIGIRKVLGATVTGVVRMLSADFVKLVLIATVIASPIAGWAMNKWLENFAYHIDVAWWMFVLAGIAAVTIALLTVSWRAIRAAVANPVDALRDE